MRFCGTVLVLAISTQPMLRIPGILPPFSAQIYVIMNQSLCAEHELSSSVPSPSWKLPQRVTGLAFLVHQSRGEAVRASELSERPEELLALAVFNTFRGHR